MKTNNSNTNENQTKDSQKQNKGLTFEQNIAEQLRQQRLTEAIRNSAGGVL